MCVHCGEVAIREHRCHWCAGWTPEGKFCRTCGSQTVADELYGVGRMLRSAGVDQFTIPERIASIEADQCEHFTRMYQRQASIVTRLVDDALFVERFLRSDGWAAAIDDELTPMLPMGEAEVKEWALKPAKPGRAARAANDADRLEEIFQSNPYAHIRSLSSLARLTLDPLPQGSEVGNRAGNPQDRESLVDVAIAALSDQDPRIRAESAVVFGNWRLVVAPFASSIRSALIDALHECVRGEGNMLGAGRGTLSVDAAVALRLLDADGTDRTKGTDGTDRTKGTDGAQVQKPSGGRAPDASFQLALAFVEPEPLVRALQNHERRYAAARRLAQHHPMAELGAVLEQLTSDEQADVLAQLRAFEGPIEMLHDALMDRAERGSMQVREQALTLLTRIGRPEDAVRLVTLATDDSWNLRGTIQSILQTVAMSDADTAQFCHFLVDNGWFSTGQYGVTALAENRRLTDDFVPQVWSKALGDETRVDLLRFAEEQLNARGDDSLHAFVLHQVFGPNSASLRSGAWWVLKRWYGRETYASDGPLQFEVGVLTKYFGSVDDFLDRFNSLLRDPATLAEITLQEKLASMLRYCDNTKLPPIVRAEQFERLWTELHQVVRDPEVRHDLRSAIVRFYEHLATVPTLTQAPASPGLRDRVLAELDELSIPGSGVEAPASGTANLIREGICVN